MFPVSLNPYFNPTLSFSNPSFINPEWAMRAYAHHAWDPFSAQAYYRGLYPNVSGGIDPSLFNPTANIPSFNYPFQTQSQFPVGFQSQVPIGFGSPATPQSPRTNAAKRIVFMFVSKNARENNRGDRI